MTSEPQRCRDVPFIDRNIKRVPLNWRLFHTHFSIRVILTVEDPTVTVKCRTAIKVLFLYFVF